MARVPKNGLQANGRRSQTHRLRDASPDEANCWADLN